jgi:hypothetical protein
MLFYKIPSNSGTFELGNFFFIIFFSSYLLGFYHYLKKFNAKYFISLLNVKVHGQTIEVKKNLFFKRYLLINKIFFKEIV